IDKNVSFQLQSILPLLSQLNSFHLLDSNDIHLTHPFSSNLQILTIPTIVSLSKTSSITNLTISGCSLDQLSYYIFKHLPLLTCLDIKHCSSYYSQVGIRFDDERSKAVHLKQLMIFNFEYGFEYFKNFAKQIPKLTTLQLCATSLDMMNAHQWKQLILSSLSYLTDFKFIFYYQFQTHTVELNTQLNEFQNEFWTEQHHWYTEYSLSTCSATIYTIPYMVDSYQLEYESNRYGNQLINTFDK
ncbi:unnamed protein product, partial [Adineta ricciae]